MPENIHVKLDEDSIELHLNGDLRTLGIALCASTDLEPKDVILTVRSESLDQLMQRNKRLHMHKTLEVPCSYLPSIKQGSIAHAKDVIVPDGQVIITVKKWNMKDQRDIEKLISQLYLVSYEQEHTRYESVL